MSPVICPACGKRKATASRPPMYRYRESGIPNLWLRGGVIITTCTSCKEELLAIEKEWQLLQMIGLRLLMETRPLSGFEMRFVRGAARLSQARLAELLRLRRETISERETKENPRIPFAEEVLLRLVILRAFRQHLKEKGNNFLPPSQRKVLASFAKSFGDFAETFMQQNLSKRAKMVLAMDKKGEGWRADEAA